MTLTRAFARKKEERDEGEEKEKGEREKERKDGECAVYLREIVFRSDETWMWAKADSVIRDCGCHLERRSCDAQEEYLVI